MSLYDTIPVNSGPRLEDWFTRLFWTFDMGMSCITGFVFSDGALKRVKFAGGWCLERNLVMEMKGVQ